MLDIDRDRQRISLGLKQTQEDPWQRVVDTYNVGDELEGKVTKVVSFGAFVEILDGVEGLVHISELAQHHVENPREVVNQGDEVRVKILEIDSERRRLSLSLKRVEGQVLPLPRGAPPPGRRRRRGEELGEVRDLGLSEDVFAGAEAPARRRRGGAEAAARGGARCRGGARRGPAAEAARRGGGRRPRRPRPPRRHAAGRGAAGGRRPKTRRAATTTPASRWRAERSRSSA